MTILQDDRLTPDQHRALRRATTLGQTNNPDYVSLDRMTLAELIHVLAEDLDPLRDEKGEEDLPRTSAYFEQRGAWLPSVRKLATLQETNERTASATAVFLAATAAIPDFMSALASLCEMHCRFVKFRLIMSRHPSIDCAEVAPRSLLEFGSMESARLASWLAWRKWIYDMDNRAGQETGYMLNGVIARALGGRQHSGRNSPIRRAAGFGGGRRVDCIRDRFAYDFKARLTQAASGRARLGDEIQFAHDCRVAGFTPILLALNTDRHEKTYEMVDAYRNFGGEAYVGDEAWDHIWQQATPTMRRFVDLYIKGPMEEIEGHGTSSHLSISMKKANFSIRTGSSKATWFDREVQGRDTLQNADRIG
jgi:hypothetical protein